MFLMGMIVWAIIRNSCGTVGLSKEWKVTLFIVNLCLSAALALLKGVQRQFERFYYTLFHLPEIVNENRKKLGKLLISGVLILAASLVSERIAQYGIFKSFTVEFSLRRFAFFFVIWLLVGIVLFYRNLLAEKIEWVVFLVVFCIGSLYALELPAGTILSWDDQVHYDQVQMMSHNFDKSVLMADYNYMVVDHPRDGYFERGSYEEHVEQMEQTYEAGTIAYGIGHYLPTYQRWCYIPSAIALVLGRGLGLPFHMIAIWGRWVNLWIYAILVYLALKKLKSGKMIVAAYALFPTNLLLATSYSYDWWVNAFLLYGFCCFLGELQQPEKKLENKDIAKMLGSFFVGFGPKAIYVPLVLLTLFMPKEKFKTDRQRKYFKVAVAVIFLVVLATFMLPFIQSNGGGTGDVRGGDGVNASEQTMYILTHPITYAGTLLRFLKDYWALENARQYTTNLAYLGQAPYGILLIATTLVVAFTDKKECDKQIHWRLKVTTAVWVFGISALIATALYITYTPVGVDGIGGCQPRYLLPLIFPVLIMLGSGKMENRTNQVVYRGIILAIYSAILLMALWSVCVVKL